MRAKSSSELVEQGSAMPVIRSWAERALAGGSGRPVEFLPVAPGHGEVALEALQITARSPLGAVALETGGILIDHGWLRVLGAGSPKLARTIAGWNGLPCEAGEAYLPGAMFVADDVLGGMYAVDVGAFGGPRGNVCYFAPGAMQWRDIGLAYGDWLRRAITETDELMIERWDSWETDVRSLPGTHVYALDPAPWDVGPPYAERDRTPVTMRELRDTWLKSR